MMIACGPTKKIGNNQGQRAVVMYGISGDSLEFKKLQTDRQG
jgi:hypothetical protein